MKLSLFQEENEKEIQKPAKQHSAFKKCRPEDAIFSCWDFGKPKESTIAVRKQVKKFQFSKRKKILLKFLKKN